MGYKITLFAALLCLNVSGSTNIFPNRKSEIEKMTKNIYSVSEFLLVKDSMEMSVSEISDFPVIFPIERPVISSGFEMRKHPVFQVRKFHKGIDIAKAKGTPVYATGNGVVIHKGYDTGYGIYIEIQHAGGFRSFYAHLSKVMVNIGDSVSIAQQISCVGNSGITTGSHLHYEVRKGNRFLNPLGWCSCLLGILKTQLQI